VAKSLAHVVHTRLPKKEFWDGRMHDGSIQRIRSFARMVDRGMSHEIIDAAWAMIDARDNVHVNLFAKESSLWISVNGYNGVADAIRSTFRPWIARGRHYSNNAMHVGSLAPHLRYYYTDEQIALVEQVDAQMDTAGYSGRCLWASCSVTASI
jgi:3',5'-cyclic AMP phosphodiesterase CpdA